METTCMGENWTEEAQTTGGKAQESEESMISFLLMIPHEVESKGCDAASLPQL
jgi:hypothetical protein